MSTLHFSFRYDDQLEGRQVHLGTIGKTSWSIRPHWFGLKVESVEIVRSNSKYDVEFEITFTKDCNWYRDLEFTLIDGEESILIRTPFYDNFRTCHELRGYVTIYAGSISMRDREEVTTNAPTAIDSPNVNTLPQLSDDLLCLLDNPDSFSDTILKCGTTEIAVHKVILSARSSVFRTMFKTRMQEGCGGNIDIVDIAPDVMQAMLKYMYSGKIDHLTDLLADDLLFAADKYQLEELKMICINKLKASLTRENIFRILVLGDMHDKSLKEDAMKFICHFIQFSTLEANEEWKTLEADRPELAIDVLAFFIKYREIN